MKDDLQNNYRYITEKFSSKKFSILFFSAGFLIIVTLAMFFYQGQKDNLKKEVQTHLNTIEEYKALMIERWLTNHFYNSVPVYTNRSFINHLNGLINSNNQSYKQEILDIFNYEREIKDLQEITFYDTNANIVISSSSKPGILICDSKSNINAALINRKNIFTDFFFCDADSSIHISFYIPIFKMEEGREKALGVIALDTNPYTSLYPFIQHWPEESKTAESLIVKAEGDSIVFVSDLRFKKKAALIFKLPNTLRTLPAAKAVNGINGVVEGIDYRGEPVLASIKKIANSDWHLVTKIDESEVLQPLFEKAVYIISLAFGLLIIIALALYTRSKGMQAHLYQKLYKAETDKNIIKTNFEQYFIYASDIILLLNNDFKIMEANQKAVVELGYNHEELVGLDGKKILLDKSASDVGDSFENINNTASLIETRITRKNGSEFYAEAGLRKIEVENRIFYQAIIRNTTDRITTTNQIKKT